jgi:hypothetical protein
LKSLAKKADPGKMPSLAISYFDPCSNEGLDDDISEAGKCYQSEENLAGYCLAEDTLKKGDCYVAVGLELLGLVDDEYLEANLG